MKMLTVTFLVCAMMALTRATPVPQAEDQPETEEITVESATDTDDDSRTEESTEETDKDADGDSGTEETTDDTDKDADGDSGTEETTDDTDKDADGDSGTEETTDDTDEDADGDFRPEETTDETDEDADDDSGTEESTEETVPQAENQPETEEITVESATDADYEPGTEETTEEINTDADSWRVSPKEPDGNHDGYELSCPVGWTMSRTSVCCLRYFPENLTWAEAKQNCQSKMGSLANVIYTLDDIYAVMKTAGHENGQIWVGACNASEDPDWPMSMYQESGVTTEPHCLQVGGADYKFGTVGTTTESGNAQGCLGEKQCDARLPSVCSVILM